MFHLRNVLRHHPIPTTSTEGNYHRQGYPTILLSVSSLGAETDVSHKLPWPAARVRSPMAWPWLVFNQPDLPSIYLGAVQFVQGTLHVRVRSELDHSFICTFFVSICIGHLTSLPHEILQGVDRRVTEPFHVLTPCKYTSSRQGWAQARSINCA